MRVRALRSYLWLKLFSAPLAMHGLNPATTIRGAPEPAAPARAHGTSQPGDQRRVAKDGLAYAYQEFMEYYGDRGDERWQAARGPQLQLLRQKTAELTRSHKSHDTVQGDSDASQLTGR